MPSWLVEWGGLARRVGRKGRDRNQRRIWLDEMQLASVPESLNFTTTMVGPVIVDFGWQETKRRCRRRLPLRPGSAPGAGTLSVRAICPAVATLAQERRPPGQ